MTSPPRVRPIPSIAAVRLPPRRPIRADGESAATRCTRSPAGCGISKGVDPDEDAYSGFQALTPEGPPLSAWLRERGVRRLFVGGLATDSCVKATVLDALKEGFAVVVFEDAIRAVDPAPGDGARELDAMKAAGTIVTTVAG